MTKAVLTTKNENYPGPGEFSTKKTVINLNDDPQFFNMATVPFEINGNTMNFELRDKKWEVDVNGNSGQATSIYSFSAFGVKQPDGTVYGN